MEKLLFVLAFIVVLGINFVQGYLAQKAHNEKVGKKDQERRGTVLGSKALAVAQVVEDAPKVSVDLKTVAVGMTLLELGLDPNRRDHWSTAAKVVEAQLEQLDTLELVDRGPLQISDMETDAVIEMPSRDPIEISVADDATSYQRDFIPAE